MRLLIFDLDGTLIDSSHVMAASFTEAYRAVGGTGEPPLDQFYRLLGDAFPNILVRLGLPAEMAPLFKAAAQRRVRDIVPVKEAIAACVDLDALDVPMAILTGKDKERTEEILDLFGIGGYFSAVATGSDGFAPKPEPDGVLLLCERLGFAPERSVMIGDSVFDIVAGRDAGAVTVGCAWGMSGEQELAEARPDVLLRRPEQLTACLSGLLDPVGADGRHVHD